MKESRIKTIVCRKCEKQRMKEEIVNVENEMKFLCSNMFLCINRAVTHGQKNVTNKLCTVQTVF